LCVLLFPDYFTLSKANIVRELLNKVNFVYTALSSSDVRNTDFMTNTRVTFTKTLIKLKLVKLSYYNHMIHNNNLYKIRSTKNQST